MTAAAETSAACRSCGKAIRWARTPSGKDAPYELDAANGTWVIIDGIAQYEGKAPAFLDERKVVPRWTSHFSTCPQAGHWRAKKP